MKVPRKPDVLERLKELNRDPVRLQATPVSGGPTGAAGKDGRDAGLLYKFSTNVAESDPGAGFLKINNAGLGSATRLRLSETDANGNNVATYLAGWDDSTNAVRGQVIIRSRATDSDIAIYDVTGVLTDKGAWVEVVVTAVSTGGALTHEEEVSAVFIRAGDQGTQGIEGKEGPGGAAGKEGPAGSTANSDWKNSVRVATTANIATATALNPGDSIDGVVLAENDRVLVKDQTTKSQNGIWVVKAVPVRAEDADAVAELSGGSTIYVEEGTRNKRRTFQVITPGNITPGTTAHEYLQLGFKDFGLVEALPTSEAVKNDKCSYYADKANGIFWDLIYDGEGEYPWKYIGGAPLHAEIETDQSTTSGSYTALATAGPSLTVPLKGDYDVEISARIFGSESYGAMSYEIGGVAPSNNDAIKNIGAVNGGVAGIRKKRKTGLAASAALVSKYLAQTAGKSVFFSDRRMTVWPVRVG
jgi:hypothetical protein